MSSSEILNRNKIFLFARVKQKFQRKSSYSISLQKLILVSDSNNSFDEVFILLTGFMCKPRRHMKNSGEF